MRSILNDDRMEAFIWPVKSGGLFICKLIGLNRCCRCHARNYLMTSVLAGESDTYFAFEVNKAGGALVSSVKFCRKFEYVAELAIDTQRKYPRRRRH